MEKKKEVDQAARDFVGAYGWHSCIAALARYANQTGSVTLFRRLDKIYVWLTGVNDAKR